MTDQWTEAFLSTKSPQVFHSVEHTQDVWREDPFDVPEIHHEAREVFERLVEQVSSSSLESGRILLLRGEAGSGKTHLIRAFRNYVHRERRAFFGYMQMTSSAKTYDRYVLQKLVESLDQPYHLPANRETSLRRLSNAITHQLPQSRVEALRFAEDPGTEKDLVNELTDRLANRLDCADLDLDIARALLYLQVDRPSVNIRVIKYLRAETLSDYDLRVLGDMAPRCSSDDAMHLVKQLAVIIRQVLNRSLVVCLDQMEDIFNLDDTRERFTRVMDAVKQLGEIPGTVAVLSCLDAFYINMRECLTESVLARVEQDPTPVVLSGSRSSEEIAKVVGRRLTYLYDTCGVEPAQPDTHPLKHGILTQLRGTTRDVLRDCLLYRERAQALGALPQTLRADEDTPIHPVGPVLDSAHLEQAWNDFSNEDRELPEDEAAVAELLSATIRACGEELGAPGAFEVAPVENAPWLRVKHMRFEGSHQDLLIAVCDRGAKGGGLVNQLKAVSETGSDLRPVIARSTAFPASPKSQTNLLFGRMVAKRRARRVVLESTDLRHMLAAVEFRKEYQADAAFGAFLQETKPLCSLAAVQQLLVLDELTIAPSRATTPAVPTETTTKPSTAPAKSAEPSTPKPNTEPTRSPSRQTDTIFLGQTLSRTPRDVTLDVHDLKRHVTFMGGTGSGKTTAALLVLEELLMRDVSVLLVDRKGDLCGYADPTVWDVPLGDVERDGFRAQLRDRVQVELYTPGNPKGRGLEVPILPPGTASLDDTERELIARVAAAALSDILGLGKSQRDQGQIAVLQAALKLLGAEEGGPLRLDTLVSYLQERDEALLAELGGLEKFVDHLAINLEIVARNRGLVMGVGCEPLSMERLLTRSESGRARLSIISTKFLGGLPDVQFWVAQLLLEVTRWFNKHPSGELQAAVMLDEADIYLPATRQPATKAPVEDLLRRARTLGVSMFLATQSPGDLDYKCRDNIRTWLVGLLAQKTATDKLKDMFAEAHADTSQLANQKVGQFHLLAEGRVTRVQLRRNSVKLPTQVPEDRILELAAAGRG